MKSRNLLKLLAITSVILIVAASAAVVAAPPPNTPLPLPDVILYGTTSRDGEPVESGTVKAVLPRDDVVSAPIGPISGTDYTYVLAVPLSMYDPDNGIYQAGSARVGEAISFYIDDTLALFHDNSGIARSEFVIPAGAMGEAYIVNLTIVGPDAYPLGDVNVSGRRDSADALLVLRYDVGLIIGVQDFPPGPRTIYVPLCDIIQDGLCNSSDALRILQCDAGIAGVDCPQRHTVTLTASHLEPAEEARLVLRAEMAAGSESDTITVRVIADDPLAELGAASLELRYDPVVLAPEGCTEDPDGSFSAAVCNAAFSPDAVRVNAVSIVGAGEGAALAEITFRVLTPVSALDDLADGLALAVDAVFDLEGDALAWRTEGAPDAPPPARRYRVYLPLIGISGQ